MTKKKEKDRWLGQIQEGMKDLGVRGNSMALGFSTTRMGRKIEENGSMGIVFDGLPQLMNPYPQINEKIKIVEVKYLNKFCFNFFLTK